MIGSRQRQAARYLVALGYPLRGAAAIVGNLVQESGADLRSKYLPPGKTDHGSQGIAQWRLDRLSGPNGLEAFARAKRLDVEALETQLSFLVYELDHDYPLLDRQLREGRRTLENLTANFSAMFERPAKRYENLDARIRYARVVRDDAARAGSAGPVVAGGAVVSGAVGAGAVMWQWLHGVDPGMLVATIMVVLMVLLAGFMSIPKTPEPISPPIPPVQDAGTPAEAAILSLADMLAELQDLQGKADAAQKALAAHKAVVRETIRAFQSALGDSI